jgi:hypothetical protein
MEVRSCKRIETAILERIICALDFTSIEGIAMKISTRSFCVFGCAIGITTLTVSSLIYAMHVKYAGLRHGADSPVSFAWAPNAVRFYEVLQVIGSDGTNTLKINAVFYIVSIGSS